MSKEITVAQFRDVYNQFVKEEISMSRMIEIFNETKFEKPTAYEFHNYETGHCYVDYVERERMTEKEGYTKIPLHNFKPTRQ